MMKGHDAPVIHLHRRKRLDTYEIMESELRELDEATSREMQALTFLTASATALLSWALGWAASANDSPAIIAMFAAVTVVLVFATGWFAWTWLRERRHRPALLNRIRQRMKEECQ